jgi:hypothetical protein
MSFQCLCLPGVCFGLPGTFTLPTVQCAARITLRAALSDLALTFGTTTGAAGAISVQLIPSQCSASGAFS